MVLLVKALAVWMAILLMAVANGVFREKTLIPRLGKTPGLVLSGLLLCLLILVVTCFALPWLHLQHPSQAIGIGLGWLALTLAFEFALGRFQGKSWSSILAAYTCKDGNLWPLVLLLTAAAPYIAARYMGLQP